MAEQDEGARHRTSSSCLVETGYFPVLAAIFFAICRTSLRALSFTG